MVLTDPPYGINYVPRNIKWKCVLNDNLSDYCLQWFKEIKRVGKSFIVFGANNFIKYIPDKYGWLVWDKRLSEKGDKMFGSPFELAISKANKYKMYRVQHGGVINADSIIGNNEKRVHPTQKPIILFSKILNDFSNENDLILDPFLGSGTTAIACKRLNRKYIGIEISSEYCEVAKKRLLQEELSSNKV